MRSFPRLLLAAACLALTGAPDEAAGQPHAPFSCQAKVPVMPPHQIDNNPPPIPTLLAPGDGAVVGTATPTFRWGPVTDPEGDTVIFEIQADDDPAFGSPEIDGHRHPDAAFTPARPLPAGTYCWRVRAIDDINAESPYSAAFTVTIPANAAVR
jgi:hypothetical protein